MTFRDQKKVELHCHLDGSLPLPLLEELAQTFEKNNAQAEHFPRGKELLRQVQVSSDNASLDEYLGCFGIPLTVLKCRGSIRESVLAVLEDVAKENVIYTELRFAPLPLEIDGYKTRDMIEDAIAGLEEGFRRFGVRGNMILCAMRHVPQEENLQLIHIGREYLGSGVCAVDIAGSEAMFPVTLHSEFFHEAKRLGMPFTIHAGECGDPASVRAAIDLGAARIGHGIAAAKDPELMKECLRRHIPLEMCPISNMQTRAVSSMDEYPFPLFYEEGLPITINTDNRQVSNTTLTKEFTFLRNRYSITEKDVTRLTLNAVEAAFTTDDIKHILWKEITQQR